MTAVSHPAAATRSTAVAGTTSLSDVAHLTRPLVLARDQTVAMLPGLTGLVPEGGLQRGSTVVVEGGPGATSLALALAAGPSAAGGWVAVVGRPDLGLAAAVEAGIVAERLVLVAEPPGDQWAAVVAALVGAVDVVLAGPQRVGAADARRLAARARERGTVLVQIAPRAGSPEADAGRRARGRPAVGGDRGRVAGAGPGPRAPPLPSGRGRGHRSTPGGPGPSGRAVAARRARSHPGGDPPLGSSRAPGPGRRRRRAVDAAVDGSFVSRRSGRSGAYAGADVDRLVDPQLDPGRPGRPGHSGLDQGGDDVVELSGAS